MPSTTSNIVTTTLLTLICAAVLFLSYRHAIRPILSRYNIPLQSLPSILTSRSRGWMDSSYQRLDPDNISYDSDNEDIDVSHARNGRRLSRDLEEGFRDSDSDEEEERDERLGGNVRRNNSNLRELPPTPVDDEPRDRFPATRI
ncbi:hypothetical protein AOL_s00076g311 [Orbilia oligospora ATCC 24927]|uniref:Uncharacterized protein n=2 Tax=Orbilia oligospora TaxID=2813651 RepID=G1X9K4_ARTOA|nr:hypothetical protein AOL_s00076g311 [Orbilia oligospora ATCC 24927]EGX50236.1 hypothetical protein AOL_s00076g311 [Orbilia oligospora ATCC 24927]KAF3273224.1 hypothetical protein TWF970_009260 [Orbilia oligospora]